LVDFTALCFLDIVSRSITKLSSCKIFSGSSDAMLDVVPFEAECAAFFVDSAQCNVNVGMFGVVMLGRYPFQASTEITLHLGHQVTSEFLEIQAIPKFGRDDQFEQSLVASGLPLMQSAVNGDAVTSRTEAFAAARLRVRCAFACYVASVSFPLARSVVRRVCDADCTSLLISRRSTYRRMRLSAGARHPRHVHYALERDAPYLGFVRRHRAPLRRSYVEFALSVLTLHGWSAPQGLLSHYLSCCARSSSAICRGAPSREPRLRNGFHRELP